MFRRCIRHAQALLKTKVTEGKGGGADQLSAASKQPSTPFAPHTGCDFSRSRAVSFHNHSGETFCPFASHGLYQDPRQRSSPPYPTAQLAHFATSAGPPGPDHPDQPSSQQDAQSPADHQQTLPAVLEVETDIDDDDSPPGPREMSLEEYDSVLDRWGELLQEGKLDETLDLMEYAYGGYDPLPPLEQMLAMGTEDEGKAARRAREQALQEDFARQRVQVIDDLGRSYATGKRKTSIARVWLKPGTGIISVNGRGFDHIFPTLERRRDVLTPFAITGTYGNYDVKATVRGGGVTGQAQALRHGIGKALQLYDPGLRPPLKSAGLLTRDARVVERKKPGRAKARKSFQWVKR